MPLGYLLGLCIVTVGTLAALAPPRRPRSLAFLGYLAGVVVAEVPHVFALLLGLSTLLAFLEGDLGGDPASLLLLGWAVGTTVGLGVLARRALGADAVGAAALHRAGVADPRGGARSGARLRHLLRVAVTPFPSRPRSVRRVGNLPYGEHRRQRLDVHHHRSRPSGGRVLLYLHGGGYVSGSTRREAKALRHRYAARGWVVVSATYRLRPDAALEDHLEDVDRAIAWTQAHAHEYGGDAAELVLAGSSAGAHLASLRALAPSGGAASGGGSVPVSAVLCLYGYFGPYDDRGAGETVPSTPLALDASDAPPFLIAHGANDSYVDVEGARRMAAKLRAESSAPVVELELPGGQHGFDLLRSWRFDAVLRAFDALLLDPRSSGPPVAAGR